jgi:YlmC/YmxH family sporulation protein
MRLSDLQSKDVISITNGKKIGNIIDIIIEEETGKIASLVVETSHSFINFLSSHQEFEIYWPDIEKIGEDVILVRMKE